MLRPNAARGARWRERAEEYRISAEACISGSTQLAYQALAEFADGVTGRMEQGTLTRRWHN